MAGPLPWRCTAMAVPSADLTVFMHGLPQSHFTRPTGRLEVIVRRIGACLLGACPRTRTVDTMRDIAGTTLGCGHRSPYPCSRWRARHRDGATAAAARFVAPRGPDQSMTADQEAVPGPPGQSSM